MADEQDKPYSSIELLRCLFGEARVYRIDLMAIIILSLLATPLSLLTPVPLKIVVDSVIGDEPLAGYIGFASPEQFLTGVNGPLAVAVILFVMVSLLSQARWIMARYLQSYTAIPETWWIRSFLRPGRGVL